MIAWTCASHALAHDFARRTRAQIAPLQAAHAAIARLELPAHHCQIYLLGVQSLWSWNDNGDATLKASSPNLGRIDHCLLLTERTPWGNFVRSGSMDTGDYAPLHVLQYHGKPIPWISVGDYEVVYLDLDTDIDAGAIDGAYFLEYRDGAFVDVTAQVRSGEHPVHFFNARPSQK